MNIMIEYIPKYKIELTEEEKNILHKLLGLVPFHRIDQEEYDFACNLRDKLQNNDKKR